MTRDEAIKDWAATIWPNVLFDEITAKDAARHIDWFAKHGILKLEEPKSARQKFFEELAYVLAPGSSHFERVMGSFDASQK